MSSTHQAQPDSQKASLSLTRASPTTCVGCGTTIRRMTATSCLPVRRSVSTPREWEIWLPLVTGATLCIAPTAVTRDPGKLAGFIERHGITVAQFVPSLLEPVMSAAAAGALRRLKRLFLVVKRCRRSSRARPSPACGAQAGQSLRPDRDDDPDRIDGKPPMLASCGSTGHVRSAARSGTRRSTSWTAGCSLFRLG